jgi:hypothetical protein
MTGHFSALVQALSITSGAGTASLFTLKGQGLLYKKSWTIPKGGNQNPYIEEEQKTQWPK